MPFGAPRNRSKFEGDVHWVDSWVKDFGQKDMHGEFYVYNSLHPIKAKYKQCDRKYFPYENALSQVFGDLFKCGIWDIMWCELYTWCKCHISLIDTLPKYAQTKQNWMNIQVSNCVFPLQIQAKTEQPKFSGIQARNSPAKQLGSQASEHGAAVTTQNPCDLWVVDLPTGSWGNPFESWWRLMTGSLYWLVKKKRMNW